MGEIGTALVSVHEKTGLDAFARRLACLGVRMIASGGTAAYLKRAGVECEETSKLTGKVELLGGLVKTLHPALHAGILADRDNPSHMQELDALGYEKIDMVVVNFYALPEARRKTDLSFIDIGGPAMARAASKNFRWCVPVPDPGWYDEVAGQLELKGTLDETLRLRLARDTIRRTGSYDARILGLLEPTWGEGSLLLGLTRCLPLRYGENPHQQAGFFKTICDPEFEVIKGELSYNNILDIDCAIEQLKEFDERAAVVVKHVGPCGVAQGDTGLAALENAYGSDPVSAFGGVIGVNFHFGVECADFLAKRFVECIVAPGFDPSALEILAKKKARLVTVPPDALRPSGAGRMLLRSALGGVLVEAGDDILFRDELKFVSGPVPTDSVFQDLVFAWKVAKHVRSNAIVFAKDMRTLGIGAGQPSRVDATRIAIMKAKDAGHGLEGSVVASDGFFPFPDSVELAARAGARAVIQPGGSIRDEEVIDAAKKLGLTMALTSIRHFKH